MQIQHVPYSESNQCRATYGRPGAGQILLDDLEPIWLVLIMYVLQLSP